MLTGIGKGLLSFLSRAFCASWSVAVAATYSMISILFSSFWVSEIGDEKVNVEVLFVYAKDVQEGGDCKCLQVALVFLAVRKNE